MNRTVLAISLGLALSATVTAQTAEAESDIEVLQIIGQTSKFSALKSDTSIMQTARSLSVITNDDFSLKGALTLDDTLAYTSGVIGDTFGFSTRGDFIAIRGFEAPEYRDGMQSLSGNYNNTRPEVYTLEQVEVLKGPASVLFGPGSPGGIVNVVSKRPGENLSNEVVFEIGSFDRTQIATDLNYVNSDNSVMGRFVGLYRDSQTQIEQVNDDSLVIAPSITFRPGDSTEITVLADYTKRESDTAHQFLPVTGTLLESASGLSIDPTAYVGEPGFNQYDTESWALTLLAEQEINDTLSVDLSSRYRDGESIYRQTWVSFAGNGIARITDDGWGPRSWYKADGFSTQFQVDARLRAEVQTGELEHSILVGASHQNIDSRTDTLFLYGIDFTTFDFVGGLINVFDPVYGFTPDLGDVSRGADSNDRIYGVYVHDEITWGNWVVNAGVRFDEVDNEVSYNGVSTTSTESAASLSVSALYNFDNGLRVYANYSESFNPVVGTDTVTNEAFKPEEGQQYELGLKFQPSNTEHLFTAAIFDIELSNLSNPNSLVNAPSQQEGVSTVQGFESDIVLNFGEVSIDAFFTILDSEDPDGNQRSSIPESKASLWFNYEPEAIEGLYTGVGVRYTGESESSGISALTGDTLTYVTPNYTVLDLLVGYTVNDWDFSINVRNAADKEYYATCLARGDCFPGEVRSVSAKVSYQF